MRCVHFLCLNKHVWKAASETKLYSAIFLAQTVTKDGGLREDPN